VRWKNPKRDDDFDALTDATMCGLTWIVIIMCEKRILIYVRETEIKKVGKNEQTMRKYSVKSMSAMGDVPARR
jgi:hypothetical protein